MKKRLILVALSAIVAVLAVSVLAQTRRPARAGTAQTTGAVHAFLRIDGIPGESSDERHRDEIDVTTYEWGEASSGGGAIGSPGRTAGRVQMEPFNFSMLVNKASPKLFQACARSEHIREAVLTVRNSAGQEYLVWKLTDVVVTSFKTAADLSGDARPMDQVGLNFERIEVSYRPVNPDGTMGGEIRAGWDKATNRSF